MIGKFAEVPSVNYPSIYSTLSQAAHSLDALRQLKPLISPGKTGWSEVQKVHLESVTLSPFTLDAEVVIAFLATILLYIVVDKDIASQVCILKLIVYWLNSCLYTVHRRE